MLGMIKRGIIRADAGRLALGFVIFGPKMISWRARMKIVARVWYAVKSNRGRSASTFGEQLFLVRAILSIPPEKPGLVAEFGCYKGLSTVAISIAARYAGRRVIVFDSFQGLPEPSEMVHQVTTGAVVDYRKGNYAGTLEEVRSLVARHGEIDRVEFVEGFFCQTLPRRPADEKYVLIFEDADLIESVRDVLKHAWPRLLPAMCSFFMLPAYAKQP